MKERPLVAAGLVVLAGVFTIGLTFATVELPYLLDGLLQNTVRGPGFDSQADALSLLKTELYIGHFHLRLIGYACFGLTVLLVVVGFATRRHGAAAVGALALMLPVFAQFAAVMFFLAGLGLLNLLWLPVLDISFRVQELGAVIRAPYQLWRWLFRLVGANGYWPAVYLCIGGGLLIFFLGTLAWLRGRARHEGVADAWVYRFSRHPQYLGWILWSYGAFLLLLQARYPMRSWGIEADLSWLLATMVIVGVAMLEELEMQRRHGAAYGEYARRTPFLVPLPRAVRRLFALPCRLLFRGDAPGRKREVAAIVSLYTVLLIAASAFFYGGGWAAIAGGLTSAEARQSRMEELVRRIRERPDVRTAYGLTARLAGFGEPAVEHLVRMLQDERVAVRDLAAEALQDRPSRRAVPALIAALGDPSENVRSRSTNALVRLDAREAAEPIARLLGDQVPFIRTGAVGALAALGATALVADTAIAWSAAPERWVRAECVTALGALRVERALPAVAARLRDDEPEVRQAAVVALLRIGTAAAREALRPATGDPDWQVRVYATEALRRLGRAEGAP